MQLAEEGLDDKLICAVLGIKNWELQRYKQRFEQRRKPFIVPKKLEGLPL